MSNSAVLQCQGLSKTFGKGAQQLKILEDIDLTINSGDTLSIVGTSGVGKSTLLHCLGGLDKVSAGSVHIDGKDVSRMGEAARGRLRNQKLGFVYQFHHLLPEFSALENVAMPLLIARQNTRKARDAAQSMLERVGLGERLSHKPSQLSGGERQRAAIARSLINNPSCILADEPTGNLDEETAASVYDLMLNLNQELGTALVLVTHDRKLAAKTQRCLRLHNHGLSPIE